jgi:hypothetical protein
MEGEPAASACSLYHERQTRLCCGVHALNACFQRQWIDAARLDRLAERVAAEQGAGGATGAFRSWLPRLGNYDISVLVAALEEGQGARFSQHLLRSTALDAELAALRAALLRQQEEQQQQQQQQQLQQEGEGGATTMTTTTTGPAGAGPARVQGILVNIRSRNSLSRWLWDGRHWLALVRSPVNGLWYDMDSKLPSPRALGDVDALLVYVRQCIEQEDGQAFVVEVGGLGQTQLRQPG